MNDEYVMTSDDVQFVTFLERAIVMTGVFIVYREKLKAAYEKSVWERQQ